MRVLSHAGFFGKPTSCVCFAGGQNDSVEKEDSLSYPLFV